MNIENIDVLQQTTDTTILKDEIEYKGNISCAHVAKNLLEMIYVHNNSEYKHKLSDNNHWIKFAKNITLDNILESINISCVTNIHLWLLQPYKRMIICEKYSNPCQIDIENWKKLAHFKYKLLNYLYYVLVYGENFILYITKYNANSGNPIIYRYNSNNTIQKDILDNCNSYIAHIILTPIENINVQNNDDKKTEKAQIISDIQNKITNLDMSFLNKTFDIPVTHEYVIYYNCACLISLECFHEMLIASNSETYKTNIDRITSNIIHTEQTITDIVPLKFIKIYINTQNSIEQILLIYEKLKKIHNNEHILSKIYNDYIQKFIKESNKSKEMNIIMNNIFKLNCDSIDISHIKEQNIGKYLQSMFFHILKNFILSEELYTDINSDVYTKLYTTYTTYTTYTENEKYLSPEIDTLPDVNVGDKKQIFKFYECINNQLKQFTPVKI